MARRNVRSPQDLIARAMTEANLQATVIELAETLGYTVFHIRDSRAQNVVGYPDLVIAGNGRLLYAELKRENGQLTPSQQKWRDLICEAKILWYLWRPSDWLTGAIEEALSGTSTQAM